MIRDFPSLAKKKIFKPYLWNMHLRWHWTKRFFHLGRLHHWIVSRWVLSIKRWHSRSGMSWHCHMTWSCNTMTGTCFNLELRKVCSLVFPFTFLVGVVIAKVFIKIEKNTHRQLAPLISKTRACDSP